MLVLCLCERRDYILTLCLNKHCRPRGTSIDPAAPCLNRPRTAYAGQGESKRLYYSLAERHQAGLKALL